MIHGGENRNIYMVLVGKLGRNRRLEDLGLDGGEYQFCPHRSWTVFFWLRTGARGGLL
jgi:hypothetical protein